MRFRDRRQAGRALATLLTRYRHRRDAQVLALGRRAVPVACEVARALELPLAFFGVCTLAAPHRPELPFGAVTSSGVLSIDREVIAEIGLPLDQLEEQVARERQTLRSMETLSRHHDWHDLEGMVGILVDEGLPTASVMQASMLALRALQPARLVLAVPVASANALGAVEDEADEVACVLVPRVFDSLAVWYEELGAVTDEEARSLLREVAREQVHAPLGAP